MLEKIVKKLESNNWAFLNQDIADLVAFKFNNNGAYLLCVDERSKHDYTFAIHDIRQQMDYLVQLYRPYKIFGLITQDDKVDGILVYEKEGNIWREK